jgi:selenocysteine lyase/cysteine desulfurase
MTTLEQFRAGFSEEPGFLDYASYGPFSRAVVAESDWQRELVSRSRFGSMTPLSEQHDRAAVALAGLLGFRSDQVVLQPDSSVGAMQAVFGLTGPVLLSRAEYPSLTFAVVRAEQSLSVTAPIWLETDEGRVTPGGLRDQLTSTTVAVAVSLVDPRTGYLVDIDGIRQVIGDRLLLVDVVQGLGVTEAPLHLADVVIGGGQTWLRAGWGTGFLALSDRAVDRLTPVFSGYRGTGMGDRLPWDDVPEPARAASAFRVTGVDPLAAARLATAVEEVSEVGVEVISRAVEERVDRLLELADRFAIPVVSPRAPSERAGIVVLEPASDQVARLTASLHNYGVTASEHDGRIRLSAHAGTDDETLTLLKAALTSFAAAIRIR